MTRPRREARRLSRVLTLFVALVCTSIASADSAATVAKFVEVYGRTSAAPNDVRLERQRQLLRDELIQLGATGLPAVSQALSAASEDSVRAALREIARWQLAAKITPVLQAGLATNLRYDGQYDQLREEGEDVSGALLLLIDDEATTFGIRMVACNALADTGDRDLLPELRRLFHDPLLAPALVERIGILLAVFGDTHAVDQELSTLESLDISLVENPDIAMSRDLRLAELYYEIRDYTSATGCYERLIPLVERNYLLISGQVSSAAQKQRLRQNVALVYYNASCSYSLKGDLENAKKNLRRCIELDPTHLESLRSDGDLKRLRESEGFEEFRNELRKLKPRKSL